MNIVGTWTNWDALPVGDHQSVQMCKRCVLSSDGIAQYEAKTTITDSRGDSLLDLSPKVLIGMWAIKDNVLVVDFANHQRSPVTFMLVKEAHAGKSEVVLKSVGSRGLVWHRTEAA
jgi:hypothetical protein